MNEVRAQKETRSLAEIESDLIKAEKSFADADARYRKAQQDRKAALSMIDNHQDELDECLLKLRQSSVPGTRWCLEQDKSEEPLNLHSEDIVPEFLGEDPEDADLAPEAPKWSASKDFDIHRASAKAASDDPVLKVVSASKG